ncbi:MAG: hypothetical protein RMK57_16195 [Bryobacterales bacterium]|nr:hypothetical protein [Bryobacterales bacterium]
MKKEVWRTYRDLYAGGQQFTANAAAYLVRRHKEPAEVYAERLRRVFYENYLGSIIDWYAATLFRREPVVTLEGENEAAKEFFATFIEDCDLKGTSLTDFFRKQLIEAMVTGCAHVLVDFPRKDRAPTNRAEEEAQGWARAYLLGYRSEEVINWSYDDRGNLDWVVVRTAHLEQRKLGDGRPAVRWRWSYYDKEEFRIYEATEEDRAHPRLVSQGRHGLAGLGRVPLFRMEVSDGLWLANKAASLQLEHFNKSNALSWALTMGLFASPVIYSDREWHQIVGESYYIQLGPEDRFGWTEPEGHVFQIAADNLDRLKNEIYRVCYLMTQAGGAFSGNAPQSGLSKQRDYTVTQEVLRAYGDTVKDTLKRVLGSIAAARGDGLRINVSGLDEFDIGDFSGELEDGMKLLQLAQGSKTLRKQVLKKLSLKYLCDVRQDIKDRIAQEIDEWCDAAKDI